MILKIEVEGETHTIDIEREMGISESMEMDRAEVSAKIAFWGAVWAGAQFGVDQEDLAYRNWRATQLMKEINGTDPATGKPMTQYKSEWAVEASPGFREMKSRVAEATLILNQARVVYEAYIHKAEILARLALRDRIEQGTAGELRYSREEGPPSSHSTKVRAVERAFERGEQQ